MTATSPQGRHGDPRSLRHPSVADAAETVVACASRNGRLWWTVWEGLQWSPTSLADGRPYHGALRLVLAATALAVGYGDRRWATVDELDVLGYRIRKADRILGVPIDTDVEHCLYNAELGRRKRGTGARHDSPVPGETIVKNGRTLVILAVSKHLMPPSLSRRGTPGLASYLRTMALACTPREALSSHAVDDAAALRSLVADIACAMALSDLGIAPAKARDERKDTGNTLTKRWATIIQANPRVLAECADLAEATASALLATLLTEGLRARKRAAGNEPARPKVTDSPRDGAQGKQRQHPSPPGRARLSEELHGLARPNRHDMAHSTSTQGPPARRHGYTLREEVEESRRASEALAKSHTTNAQGSAP